MGISRKGKLIEASVRIPLAGKLDESVNPHLLPNESVSIAENILYKKHGKASKSPGWSAESFTIDRGGADLAKAHGAFQHNGQLCVGSVVDDPWLDEYYGLYSYEEDSTKFRRIGTWSPGIPLTRHTVRAETAESDLYNACHATCNGYRYIAWLEGDRYVTGNVNIYLTVIEDSTGAVVLGRQAVTSAAGTYKNLHVVTVDDSVHLFIQNTTGNAISLYVLDSSTPETIPSALSIIPGASAHANCLMDVTTTNDSTYGECSVVAFKNNGGLVEARAYDEDGTNRRAQSISYADASAVVCVARVTDESSSTQTLAIAYQDTSDSICKCCQISRDCGLIGGMGATNLLGAGAFNTIKAMTISECRADSLETGDTDSAYRVWIEYLYDEGGSYNAHRIVVSYRVRFQSPYTVVDLVQDHMWRRYALLSKAFHYQNRSHVWLRHSQVNQGFAVLVTVDEKDSANKCKRSVAMVASVDQTAAKADEPLPYCISDTAGIYAVPMMKEITAAGRMVSIIDSDFVTAASLGNAESNNGRYLPGGIVSMHNQTSCVETDFMHSPDLVYAAVSAGGSLVDTATYYYRARFEWIDAAGNWCSSDISRASESGSFPESVTIAAPNQTWTVGYTPHVCGDHDKQENDIRVCIYRTNPNETQPFYLLAEVANDPDADMVTFADDGTVVFTSSTPVWAEDDYVIGPGPPPPTKSLVAHRDRLWAVDSENARRLFYTHSVQTGYSPKWSPEFYIDMPAGVVALASMGDSMVALCEKAIYVINGNGPDAWGQGGFLPPSKVTVGIGCTAPGSVAQTHMGIMFQSREALYLLTPGGLNRVGDVAQDILDGVTILDTVQMTDTNQLRFILDDDTILVWDTVHDRWSQWTGHTDIDVALEYIPAGSDPIFAWFANPVVLALNKETPTAYTRGGASITSKIKTGVVNLQALAGYVRLWAITLIGTWKSAHSAVIKIYQDYDLTTADETITVSAATSTVPYLIRVRPRLQRCASFALEVSDSAQSGTKESFELTALELTVGVDDGVYLRTPTLSG